MSVNGTPPPKALLLDLDGTVADSLPVLYSVYEAFLANFGRTGTPREFSSLNGVPIAQSVATLRTTHLLEPSQAELQENYMQRLGSFYDHVQPTAGARELLGAAFRKDIPVAIVTSSPTLAARGWLERKGLAPWVRDVIGANDVRTGKPDPEPYLVAARRFGLAPKSCWSVEDSRVGLEAALAAGTTAFYYWPDGSPTSYDPGERVRRIRRLSDLVLVLETPP